jgi:azurin
MKKLLFTSILFALIMALTACGGEEASQPADEVVVDDGVRTVEIIGTDDMKFVVRESAEGLRTGGQTGQYLLLEAIYAEPGEELRIRLTTISNLPPTAMSHNLAVVDLGTDVDAFARASITARDNEYIAPDFADRVIVTTRMLGNGETDTITFTVPEQTGEYDYLCTFPGHFAGGMVGKLIVQ